MGVGSVIASVISTATGFASTVCYLMCIPVIVLRCFAIAPFIEAATRAIATVALHGACGTMSCLGQSVSVGHPSLRTLPHTT